MIFTMVAMHLRGRCSNLAINETHCARSQSLKKSAVGLVLIVNATGPGNRVSRTPEVCG